MDKLRAPSPLAILAALLLVTGMVIAAGATLAWGIRRRREAEATGHLPPVAAAGATPAPASAAEAGEGSA